MINQYSNVVASLFIIKLTMMFVFILSLVGMIIEIFIFYSVKTCCGYLLWKQNIK